MSAHETLLGDLSEQSRVPSAVLRAVWLRESAVLGPDVIQRAESRVRGFVAAGPRGPDADLWPSGLEATPGPRLGELAHPRDRRGLKIGGPGDRVHLFAEDDATSLVASGTVVKLDAEDSVTVCVDRVTELGRGTYEIGIARTVATSALETRAVR